MRSTTQLKNLLSDLSVVRPSLVARQADLRAEQLQGIVHSYAVDTNILYFVGQPISQILSQEKLDRNRGYHYDDPRKQVPHTGSLFRSDDQHYHLTIGVALAQFIGFTLSGTTPLLLPDALWPEAQTLLANFSSIDDERTAELADRLFLELKDRTVKKIGHKLHQANLDPVDLEVLLQKMVQHKIGRHEGLRRLKDLFEGGSVEKLSARPTLGVNYLLRLTARPQKLGDVQNKLEQSRQDVFEKWSNALSLLGKQEPYRTLDANALTQIEIRNRIASEEGSPERTLFITLDSTVILAAENIWVDYLDCSFAEAFVRHPAAFLNDIGLGVGRTSKVEQATESEPVSILAWIDVMLSKSSAQVETQVDVAGFEERAATLVQEIIKGWHDLSEVQEDQLLLQLGIDQIETSLHDKLADNDIKVAIAKLRDEVIEEEAQAWENCFRVAIQLALNIQRQDPPTRSSPPIRYEGWPNANEAIEQFKVWGAHGLTSRKDFEDVRRQLEEGEDPSGYSYFLGSATFFAARGDWAPAAGLASFAREMAFRRTAGDRRGANGREAAYLEAVARQHLVRHVEDLSRSERLIEECKQIFEREKESTERKLEIVPERFDLELLDIEHARLLFAWDAGTNIDIVRAAMEKLLHRYRDLQLQLQTQVERMLNDRAAMSLGSLEYVLAQTEIRTIISTFLLIAVGEIRLSHDVTLIIKDMLARVTRLSSLTARRRKANETFLTQDSSVLAKVAIAAVRSLVAKADGDRPNPRANAAARNEIFHKGLRSHQTFPFDRRRFDAILRALSDTSTR